MTSEGPVEEVSSGASLKKVTVSRNGPYVVEGAIPLALQTIVSDSEGGSKEWRPLSAAVDVTITRENEEDCH